MRWQGRRESGNVEDRRGMPAGGMAVGGGAGVIVIVLLLSLLTGEDPGKIIQQIDPNAQPGVQQPAPRPRGEDDESTKFVKVVLADTEDVWKEQFANVDRRYREPKLVLFEGRVQSACGIAGTATGPFYCPGDQMVYIDLAFFDELRRRFKAPGDFAQAYVIAHEIGHHVQNLLGIMEKVDRQRRSLGKAEANRLSVRVELQADYLAGVWAHHAQKMKQILEPGDVEEALQAASAIGDDTLQKQAQGYVVPDAFTHGTSEQRIRWFRRGLKTGDLSAMNAVFELDENEL